MPETNMKITLLIKTKSFSVLSQESDSQFTSEVFNTHLRAPWDCTLSNPPLTTIATTIELNRISYEQSVLWLKKRNSNNGHLPICRWLFRYTIILIFFKYITSLLLLDLSKSLIISCFWFLLL